VCEVHPSQVPVAAEHTRHTQTNTHRMSGEHAHGLMSLLMGPPLSQRCNEDSDYVRSQDAVLTKHLLGVCELMKQVYGSSPAAKQAIWDMREVARLKASAAAITCKRASLLYAVRAEPEIRSYFNRVAASENTPEDIAVIQSLDLTTPLYEEHTCQAPNAYVMATVLLATMWQGERTGSMRLTTIPPDGNCTTLATANADEPPPDGSTATRM